MTALPPPGAPPLPPFPGSLERLGGTGVYLRRGPQQGNPPALFVHGLGGGSTNWTDLMALLDTEVDGTALDLPGFGRSDPPADGRYPLRAHARAVTAALTQLSRDRGQPVHLFGNSLGGAVSTLVAAHRPDLVATLTLISPALPNLRRNPNLDPRFVLLLLPGASRVAATRTAGVPVELRARAVLDLCYADTSRIAPERAREAVAELTRRDALAHAQPAFVGSLRGLVGGYLAPGHRSLWAAAARVRARTLLVWGRQDRLVPVRLAERAVATYRDARLVIFDDCGHVAQMELPQRTADAVRTFWAADSLRS